jgi:hypothetical protein
MRAAFVALCTLLAGCRTESAAPEAGAPYDAGLAFVFADASPSPSFAPSAIASPLFVKGDERLAAYANATPKAAKSIGHTSVVFRIDFDSDAGPLRAAYKPESKRGHKRYRGEVAAYRLGKLLALPNVPPAGVRVLLRSELHAAAQADPRSAALEADEVVDHKGDVFGALMPWIDKLEFYPLESPSEEGRWKKWLASGGAIPADQLAFAAQISTLVVFDALTGNWDRWSGANVAIDRKTSTLLFVDNDGAFFDPVPPAFAPQMTLLRGVDRFSKSLVARLRAIDALMLADAFGEEEPGVPLLPARVVAAADQRRKDVLAIVDDKIKSLGEAAVLSFP